MAESPQGNHGPDEQKGATEWIAATSVAVQAATQAYQTWKGGKQPPPPPEKK